MSLSKEALELLTSISQMSNGKAVAQPAFVKREKPKFYEIDELKIHLGKNPKEFQFKVMTNPNSGALSLKDPEKGDREGFYRMEKDFSPELPSAWMVHPGEKMEEGCLVNVTPTKLEDTGIRI